jgi:drug/metabolite transporter (DMT)-like permease
MTAGKANACVLAAGAMWGTISIFIRHLDGAGLSALQVCLIRTLLAWLITGAFLAIRSPQLLSIRLRDCWYFIGTGVISYTLFSTCYFMAVAMSQVSVAVMLLYTSPVFVTLLSAVIFHERMTRRKWLALVCTVTGCVLVAGVFQGHLAVPLPALALGLASGFLYALYSIFGRFALSRYDPLTVTFYTFTFATAAMLPLGHPGYIFEVLMGDPSLWLWVAGIAIVCSVLPYFLYTVGLQYMESGKAAIMATIEPFVGSAVGIFFFAEPHGPLKLIGMALILGSVIILNKR